VSWPMSGIWVVRGVSGWRRPIVGRGLLLLLTAGAPCVGATCWVSSGAGAGVVGRVMGLYEPSGVIRRRSRALSEDDGDTGRVLPPEVGWLPYMGGASGSLRNHPRNSAGDMVSRCGAQRCRGWNGSPSDSPSDRGIDEGFVDGVLGIEGLCMSTSRGLGASGPASSMTWSSGSVGMKVVSWYRAGMLSFGGDW
jgi:hypothetical protein